MDAPFCFTGGAIVGFGMGRKNKKKKRKGSHGENAKEVGRTAEEHGGGGAVRGETNGTHGRTEDHVRPEGTENESRSQDGPSFILSPPIANEDKHSGKGDRRSLSIDVPNDDDDDKYASTQTPELLAASNPGLPVFHNSNIDTSNGARFLGADIVQHLMLRISELESRLKAANIPSLPPTPKSLDETGSNPAVLHSGDYRGLVRRSYSISQREYSRSRAATGLTPPPSPRPEHTAKWMADSPFTPSTSASAVPHPVPPDNKNNAGSDSISDQGIASLSIGAGVSSVRSTGHNSIASRVNARTANMSPIIVQSARKHKRGTGATSNEAALRRRHQVASVGSITESKSLSRPGNEPFATSVPSLSMEKMKREDAESISLNASTSSGLKARSSHIRSAGTLPHVSFWDYMRVPIGDGPMPTEATAKEEGKERMRMLTLVRVPWHLEHTLHYGLAVCLDSFLFYITLLPLRFVYACGLCLSGLFSSHARRHIHGRHFHDIIQIAILICCTLLLKQVEMSWAYHTLRAQSFLKLYVIFNLFDILDKLMCALGQGIFDSLRWTLEHYSVTSVYSSAGNGSSGDGDSGSNNSSGAGSGDRGGDGGRRVLQHVTQVVAFSAASVVYTTTHALLSFSRMVALNVAINTQGSSLLTLLISNNFVELKASVFKRFQPENLFQITCSDIVERFHLMVFMFLIMLQNLDKHEDLHTFFRAAPIIIVCELLVDWVKHCFVSNFNRIPLEVYAKFSAVLRHDMTASFEKNAAFTRTSKNVLRGYTISKLPAETTRNHSYRVSSRIGLVNLPLACVLIRVIESQFRRHRLVWNYHIGEMIVLVVATYLFLLLVKVLLGLCLMGHAGQRYRDRLEKDDMKKATSEDGSAAAGRKTVEDFMKMKRYMIHKSRVPM